MSMDLCNNCPPAGVGPTSNANLTIDPAAITLNTGSFSLRNAKSLKQLDAACKFSDPIEGQPTFLFWLSAKRNCCPALDK